MARTEDTALSALLSALGKGVMQLPVEMEKQKEVQRQNALTQYQMMQQQEQQRRASEEGTLRMSMMRLQQQELNEKIRRAAMEPYMTEEQRMAIKQKNELEQIQAREKAQFDFSENAKKNDPYGGLTGDAKNIAILQGMDAAKQWATDQKTNKYASKDAYEKYVAGLKDDNDRIAKQNIEIEKNNNFAKKFPSVYSYMNPIPVKTIPSYEEWTKEQSSRMTSPVLPASGPQATPIPNPFMGAAVPQVFQVPIDMKQQALDILRKKGYQIGNSQS